MPEDKDRSYVIEAVIDMVADHSIAINEGRLANVLEKWTA